MTAYNVAFTILQIPLGRGGFPLGVVLLPSLSRAIAAGRMATSRRSWSAPSGCCCGSRSCMTTVGIVLAMPTVELLFGSGFDAEAVAADRDARWPGSCWGSRRTPSTWSCARLLQRPGHAHPRLVAIGSVVVNVVVSVAHVGTHGLPGLALGIALGGWFDAIILSLHPLAPDARVPAALDLPAGIVRWSARSSRPPSRRSWLPASPRRAGGLTGVAALLHELAIRPDLPGQCTCCTVGRCASPSCRSPSGLARSALRRG